MVNTNNTKFTFNKKGFALSLACAGLLATSAGAAVTANDGGSWVTPVGSSNSNYNITSGVPKDATATVSGTNTLGFASGTAVTLDNLVLEAANSASKLTALNLYVTDELLNINSGGLTIGVNTDTIALGSGATSGQGEVKFIGGSIAIDEGIAVGKVDLTHISIVTGGGGISNAGTIKNFNWNKMVTPGTADTDDFTITNTATGVIDSFTINSEKGIVGDTTKQGDFSLSNKGVINTFKNAGTLKGSDGKTDILLQVDGADATINTFQNTGLIEKATIETANGAKIGTFNNENIIRDVTFKTFTADNFINTKNIEELTVGSSITVNKSFSNSGKISSDSAAIFTIGSAITPATTFENLGEGVISGGSFTIVTEGFKNENVIKIIAEDTTKAVKFDATVLSEFTNSGNIQLGKDSAAIGNIGSIKLGNADTQLASFTNASGGKISNTNIVIQNGGVENFTNSGIILNSKIAKAADGVIANFVNTGDIIANNKAGTDRIIDLKVTNFTNASSGKIKLDSSAVNAATLTIAAENFNNEGTIISSVSGSNAVDITASKVFRNTNIIKGASTGNKITIQGLDSDRKADAVFENSGTIRLNTATAGGGTIQINGFIQSFDNQAGGLIDKVTIVGKDSAGTGAATDANGLIATFNNAGQILGSTFNTLFAEEFTNSGTIKDATFTALTTYNFTNSGVITAAGTTQGTITVDGVLTNKTGGSMTLTNAANNVTLEVGGSEKDTTALINESGASISGGTIQVQANDYLTSFINEGDINNTEIKASGATGTITTLHNKATGDMTVKMDGANLKVIGFQNDGEFKLDSGGGNLNVVKTFINTKNVDFNTKGVTFGDSTKTTANRAEGTFLNADGALMEDGSITLQGWVKAFENAGTIDGVDLTSGANTGILAFTNTGTIYDSKIEANVKDFANTNLIELNTGSVINLTSGETKGDVSFANTGTILDLRSAITVADRQNATFTNTGTINAFNTGDIGLVSLGAGAAVNFNNSGIVTLNANGDAITVGTDAKANITNTGTINLGAGGAHINISGAAVPTSVANAPVVVKEWHLTNIGAANGFNETTARPATTAMGTDKIVVRGLGTDYNRLRFEAGSIVIDPIKNVNMEVGKAYMLDRIVVDENNSPVQEVYNIDAAGLVTATQTLTDMTSKEFELNATKSSYVLKAGATDPRLVTIATVRSSDPVFEINGVDAYGAALNEKGELTTEMGKVGEVVAGSTTGARYVGDGIIDSFQVGVNASKSAGAAVVQSAVNNSITRNAFVSNVVNNAVNAALISLNNFNRVSYNDAEVDFDKLEKYAAVSSDVTDQTYAKDSNVYVMPYYRSTSVDLATNDSLDADTYGIVLGGNKNLGDAGVIGLFLGYENSDGSADKIDTEDDTFFGGINYYKTLGGTSTYDYFVKGMARLAKTSTDVTTKVGGGTSSADTFSYGVEANVGMNFYNGIHTITPEVGLSYDRVSVDGFIQSNGLSNDDQDINLVIGKVGINWLAQFTDSLSTNVGVGIRYNFNDDFDANIGIGNQRYSTTTDLGDFYYYVNLGVNYAITQNWELGVMYNGDFSSDASSHAGFVKLGYWW